MLSARSIVLVITFAFTSTLAATPVAAGIDEELAEGIVADIVPTVERIRGLDFRRPVTVEVVGPDQVEEHLLKRLDQFDLRAAVAATGKAYQLLGLLPEDTDLLQTLIDSMRSQVGGFYNPSTGAYYLMSDMPAGMAHAITAHELTHALEDQHFKLDDRIGDVVSDDDRAFAMSAVHEGSAMLVMMFFSMEQAMSREAPQPDLDEVGEMAEEQWIQVGAMPEVLRRRLLGPYVLGALFLLRGNGLAVGDGFPIDDTDALFRAGPTSSEQLLHPEKFWVDREEPVPVDLGAAGRALGPRWERVDSGTLGELTLGLMVGATTPDDYGNPLAVDPSSWTNDAAAGWSGDRWELWRRGKRHALMLSTIWDSEADAEEFATALDPALLPVVEGRRVLVLRGEVGESRRGRVLEAMRSPGPPDGG